MKSISSSPNWAAVRTRFTWVSIVSVFVFVALILAKLILWLLNYKSYPFKRQITVIAIIAFASLITSTLVLVAPDLARGFLQLSALIPKSARKIGTTTATVLVGVLVAALWFSPKRDSYVDSGAVPHAQASSEAERSNHEPPAHTPDQPNEHGQGHDTQRENSNSVPLDELDGLRETRSAPGVMWDDATKAPPAEADANVAVLRNGSVIPFIRKEQTGNTTLLYVQGGHMDIPTDQIASFEKDTSPATLESIKTGPTPLPSGRMPNRTAFPRPATYNSLPTGTRIREDNGTSGHGELTVENGTSEDAVVRLYDFSTDQTVRWFFVKANTSAHVAQIPSGVYKLAFTRGLNWIEANDSFSWHPSYSEFERTFDFHEESDSEETKYHEISVTLNPVPLGNVHTKQISRDEFMKGHNHVTLQR